MKSFLAVHLFVLACYLLCKVDVAECKNEPECRGTYLPCPEDCTKFYLCRRGHLLKLPCAEGLHWNKKRKMCDQPVNANCVENPHETVSVTDSAIDPITEDITESVTEPSTEMADAVAPVPKMEEKKVICYCEY